MLQNVGTIGSPSCTSWMSHTHFNVGKKMKMNLWVNVGNTWDFIGSCSHTDVSRRSGQLHHTSKVICWQCNTSYTFTLPGSGRYLVIELANIHPGSVNCFYYGQLTSHCRFWSHLLYSGGDVAYVSINDLSGRFFPNRSPISLWMILRTKNNGLSASFPLAVKMFWEEFERLSRRCPSTNGSRQLWCATLLSSYI